MKKSGGQRTNNSFRGTAHPNSKPPAFIPTLKKTLDRVRKQNYREATSALEPQNILTRPGSDKSSTNKTLDRDR